MSFLFLTMPQNVCTGSGRANEIPLLRIPQVRFGDCNSLKTKTGVYQICLDFQWWWVVKPLGSQNRELAFLSWCHHFTDQWCVLCFGGGKNSVHFFNQAWPIFIQAEKSFSKSSCPRTQWTELALNRPQLTFLSYSAKVLPEGRSKPEGKPHLFGSDRGLSETG